MRAVLLQLENLRLGEITDTKSLAKKLPDFSDDDVTYACMQLKDAGYIDAIIKRYTNYQIAGVVKGITYSGHQFLNTVRDNSQWAQEGREHGRAFFPPDDGSLRDQQARHAEGKARHPAFSSPNRCDPSCGRQGRTDCRAGHSWPLRFHHYGRLLHRPQRRLSGRRDEKVQVCKGTKREQIAIFPRSVAVFTCFPSSRRRVLANDENISNRAHDLSIT